MNEMLSFLFSSKIEKKEALIAANLGGDLESTTNSIHPIQTRFFKFKLATRTEKRITVSSFERFSILRHRTFTRLEITSLGGRTRPRKSSLPMEHFPPAKKDKNGDISQLAALFGVEPGQISRARFSLLFHINLSKSLSEALPLRCTWGFAGGVKK